MVTGSHSTSAEDRREAEAADLVSTLVAAPLLNKTTSYRVKKSPPSRTKDKEISSTVMLRHISPQTRVVIAVVSEAGAAAAVTSIMMDHPARNLTTTSAAAVALVVVMKTEATNPVITIAVVIAVVTTIAVVIAVVTEVGAAADTSIIAAAAEVSNHVTTDMAATISSQISSRTKITCVHSEVALAAAHAASTRKETISSSKIVVD